MKKNIYILIILSFGFVNLYSQQNNISARPGSLTIVKTRGNTQEQSSNRDVFLNEQLLQGDCITFDNDTLKNKLINYEFNSNILKIQFSFDSMACLQGHLVKEFNIGILNKSRRFVNGAKFTGAPYPVDIFEVLVEGKLELLKKYYTKDIESNYNVVLDVGSKTSKKVLRSMLYFYDGNVLIELPKSKRKILKIFSNKKDVIEEFLKNGNCNLKKESDLIETFKYYNKL